ncbi:hypothetical protein M5E06_31640 [Azospirillum sp. A1-3]|uniref:hypothetical protein n=1 Tax=Azospirillum sp. A1-3 TaxID=185874 RepID=UPI002076F324|nr:hypothetical protein [Azospirillum sp. A1-3]MCM8738664.1 hypothetical protein [Azospirillum sp. A1-3]
MTRRSTPVPLTIQVSFETTRISPQCLIDAYTHLVPTITRCRVRHIPNQDADAVVAPIKRRGDHA